MIPVETFFFFLFQSLTYLLPIWSSVKCFEELDVYVKWIRIKVEIAEPMIRSSPLSSNSESSSKTGSSPLVQWLGAGSNPRYMSLALVKSLFSLYLSSFMSRMANNNPLGLLWRLYELIYNIIIILM